MHKKREALTSFTQLTVHVSFSVFALGSVCKGLSFGCGFRVGVLGFAFIRLRLCFPRVGPAFVWRMCLRTGCLGLPR